MCISTKTKKKLFPTLYIKPINLPPIITIKNPTETSFGTKITKMAKLRFTRLTPNAAFARLLLPHASKTKDTKLGPTARLRQPRVQKFSIASRNLTRIEKGRERKGESMVPGHITSISPPG
jgi:hypothetical protein